MNAVAILTDVSLTLHFSGFGGEVMILGAPGCDTKFEAESRCLRRAKRANAGSFSSSPCS